MSDSDKSVRSRFWGAVGVTGLWLSTAASYPVMGPAGLLFATAITPGVYKGAMSSALSISGKDFDRKKMSTASSLNETMSLLAALSVPPLIGLLAEPSALSAFKGAAGLWVGLSFAVEARSTHFTPVDSDLAASEGTDQQADQDDLSIDAGDPEVDAGLSRDVPEVSEKPPFKRIEKNIALVKPEPVERDPRLWPQNVDPDEDEEPKKEEDAPSPDM